MGRRIDDNIIEQIPILYAKYKNKTKTAEELGISVITLNKYLNLLAAAPEKKKRAKITDEIIAEINNRFKDCKNMSQVARELGINAQTVKRHLTTENLKLIDKQQEDFDALWYYVYRLFGDFSDDYPVNPWNITQMHKFKSQGMSYQAQLLTLKYIYEIQNMSKEKANGSIGLIPYKFSESKLYYEREAKKADELTQAIQRQLEKDRIEIPYSPKNFNTPRKKKKLIDLNTIGVEES